MYHLTSQVRSCLIELIEKCGKTTLKFHKMALLTLTNPSRVIPDVSKSADPIRNYLQNKN